jgi:hypothetical protein
MIMSQPTPTPWQGGLQISGPNGIIIAKVQYSGPKEPGEWPGYRDPKAPPLEVALANAKLLVAAPRLKNALLAMVEDPDGADPLSVAEELLEELGVKFLRYDEEKNP